MSEATINYGHAHLTSIDIKQCRRELTDIVIAPFDETKAKGVGYNFSLSELIYSVTRKRLVPIGRDTNETYFYLRPHETILALSHEYLKADSSIAGSFHSRVRRSAQGVGNISTTLDPGWKGMLLFSLNNPTNRKIKVVLSTRTDGTNKPLGAVTLITWRTANDALKPDDDVSFALRLDNPPMRIDIWSELAAKPLRLFRNREYQRFTQLIEALASFNASPSSAVSWAAELKPLLTALRIAIEATGSEADIRATLLRIQDFTELPPSVQSCLKPLVEKAAQENLLTACKTAEYRSAIDLADREIQYQLLCDQIAQIHQLISARVPTYWRKSFWANVWHHFRKNLGVFAATLVSLFLVLYGHFTASPTYWPELVLALVPLVVSIVYHLIIERK